MIIFRPAAGSLRDAMSLAQVFTDEDEMKRWIADSALEVYGRPTPYTVEDIVISGESVNDSRIGWNDSLRVCVRRFGVTPFPVPQCIGHCATDFPKNDK